MELATPEGKIAQREPLQHVAYLHDGSLEGLLCCIFEAYVQREVPEDIVRERDYQPRFEQSSFFVQTDFNRALRVRRGIEREAGSQAFGAVVRAAANDDPCAGVVVYRFVRYVMDKRTGRDKRRNVLNDLANPVVGDLLALGKRCLVCPLLPKCECRSTRNEPFRCAVQHPTVHHLRREPPCCRCI